MMMGNGSTTETQAAGNEAMAGNDKHLTVGDAKRLYDKYGGAAFYSDDLMACDTGKPLKNSNYIHALFLTEEMFKATGHSLRMFTGAGGDGALDILKKRFREAIDRIVSHTDGIFKAIIVGGAKPKILEELEQKYPKRVKVRMARLKDPDAEVRHFVVSDGKMVRDEEPHAPITDESLSTDIRAEVYMDDPHEEKIAEERFEDLW